MNLCTACGEDFSSVSAFDRHRIGKHAYTYTEGLGMNPEHHDGRRSMDEAEMRAAGMDPNARGWWTITAAASLVAPPCQQDQRTTLIDLPKGAMLLLPFWG
ncbi:MAG TPA: hypothetical protein VLJ44_00260 [Gaiellaceae bacterium]|nr:hypothetical protein [Gaiellaceae bacterium]